MRPIPLSAGSLTLLLLAALPLRAQDEEWEGLTISSVTPQGQNREHRSRILGLSGLNRGATITARKVDHAYKALWGTGRFEKVNIEVEVVGGEAAVTIRVTEYPIVEDVLFSGFVSISASLLEPSLRIQPGDPLNSYHLMQDRETIRDEYLMKGHHFSEVREELRQAEGSAGDVVLIWRVVEGPMVSVDRIEFSGVEGVSEGDLRAWMATEENSRLLGLFVTGHNPFVERHLEEDIKRIKLFYRLEGWLDIDHGNRVFVRDLVFSEDKTSVVIRIHVEEGRRYTIRDVSFKFDTPGPHVFSPEEMGPWLDSQPGEPYTDRKATEDANRIRDRYGEKAYILAKVSPTTVFAPDSTELDLVFTITENEKIYVGRLQFEGNVKTRDDVLRREFTRNRFVPGEEFNDRLMRRSMRRIQDRNYVQPPPDGITHRTLPTAEPNVRDVVITMKEGRTGNIRFAAGFSSSFGVLGLVELSQTNFDLADLPKSFADFIGGTGFAGGGQTVRIRLAPAARRQSYTIDFREPYVFGYDFGLGLRGFASTTLRESYDDSRLGGLAVVDKRFDNFALQLGFNVYRVEIDNVDFNAPPIVQEIEGTNTVFSLRPAVIYDTRDSFIIPTEGERFEVGVEYAGQILPGDFDFNRLRSEAELHLPVYETDAGLRHVLSTVLAFGWVHGARRQKEVPLFERWYAGGRDRSFPVRGFRFRGMGPHEFGDPVGGEAGAVMTLEYSYPLFVHFLRGAFFYDLANLAPRIEHLVHDKWRNSIGLGIRFIIPQLSNIPVKLDFGFPLTKESEDDRQTVTFDVGALF